MNDKFTEEYEDEISHMAREYAYYACQVIVGEVERIYRGFFMQEMQEKLMFEKENGIAAIIKKLEGGDLDCLQKMLEYFNRSPRQNFSDFLVLN